MLDLALPARIGQKGERREAGHLGSIGRRSHAIALVFGGTMHVRRNPTQAKLNTVPVFGSSVRLPDPGLVEILGSAGFDFVVIDCEHGSIGWSDMERMILAAFASGTVPFVRVLKNDAEAVMRTLDLGAQGILIPHVRCGADARALRSAALYPPEGIRGVGPGRSVQWGAVPTDEYFRCIGNEITLLGLVEDAVALDDLDSIATAGLNVIWVGAHDLAASLGVIGQPHHPLVEEATARILEVATKHGVAVGYPAQSASDAADAIQRGFRVIGFGTAESYVYRMGRDFIVDVLARCAN